jgi:hypothetical protein
MENHWSIKGLILFFGLMILISTIGFISSFI